MKVTAFSKYTGEKIYELELKECCYTFCPQFDDQEVR